MPVLDNGKVEQEFLYLENNLSALDSAIFSWGNTTRIEASIKGGLTTLIKINGKLSDIKFYHNHSSRAGALIHSFSKHSISFELLSNGLYYEIAEPDRTL